MHLTIALVVSKEKDLVVLDRTTDGAAELVLVIRPAQRVQITFRIQIRVPQKFEHISMDAIRS